MSIDMDSDLRSGEQRVTFHRIRWDAYVAIGDLLTESSEPRLSYIDGRLTLLTASRSHEWYAERLGQLIIAIANVCGMLWEDAGGATYRQKAKEVGVEPDKAFYFGANAERMRGAVNVDLSRQPPPDLVVEVEVTHPADDSMLIYARLGVAEVWRFNVGSWSFTCCLLGEDGTYTPASMGRPFPGLGANDVQDQLRIANAISAARWFGQVEGWVRTTLVPRMGG